MACPDDLVASILGQRPRTNQELLHAYLSPAYLDRTTAVLFSIARLFQPLAAIDSCI